MTKAILFALFLSGLNVHRFYLNQVSYGILMLLFFWTFILAIIAIVDIIHFAMLSNKEFDANYPSVHCRPKTSKRRLLLSQPKPK
jgi:TM2 domain-containing membrane protein YozV